jgi:hypothetical protein
MTEGDSAGSSALVSIVALLAIALAVVGAAWYGFSSDVLQRQWQHLVERPGGPMAFRFLLQPAMAAITGAHDGIEDARTGRSPYFWTVLHDPQEREVRLREAAAATSRIILLGIAMDAIYQARVFKTFYPGEALIVAFVLACIPYFLIRGPACRIARWWINRLPSSHAN